MPARVCFATFSDWRASHTILFFLQFYVHPNSLQSTLTCTYSNEHQPPPGDERCKHARTRNNCVRARVFLDANYSKRPNRSAWEGTSSITIHVRRRSDVCTSSNGRVSLKQLSQTSFTARAAVASSGQFGFARTDNIALRRTHACVPITDQKGRGQRRI